METRRVSEDECRLCLADASGYHRKITTTHHRRGVFATFRSQNLSSSKRSRFRSPRFFTWIFSVGAIRPCREYHRENQR